MAAQHPSLCLHLQTPSPFSLLVYFIGMGFHLGATRSSRVSSSSEERHKVMFILFPPKARFTGSGD